MCITHVTGENPNATDSGHVFARKARQVLGIREDQILYPEVAIQKLCCNDYDNIVFVDDFLGSGEQAFATLHRPYLRELEISFSSFLSGEGVQLFYIPLLASEFGIKRVTDLCPNLILIPANVLPKRFSVFDPETVVWPDELRNGADHFIKNTSKRAGCGDGYGMAGLGYQVAFFHSTPDATLPIFWSEKNGWKPLVRRL
jgi:hypothetical protein